MSRYAAPSQFASPLRSGTVDASRHTGEGGGVRKLSAARTVTRSARRVTTNTATTCRIRRNCTGRIMRTANTIRGEPPRPRRSVDRDTDFESAGRAFESRGGRRYPANLPRVDADREMELEDLL